MKIRGFPVLQALFVMALTLGGSFAAWGAGVSYDQLNLPQGFNFARDVQDPFGFVQTLKIGGTVIKPDMKLRGPEELTKERTALPTYVGVLSKINWGGGQGDPFEFQVQVSTYNKQQISTLLHKTLENITLEFSFLVWDYDPLAKKYYPGFFGGTQHTAKTVLKGLIYKEGKDLQIKIEGKGTEVSSPENWGLSLKVAPQPNDQDVTYAVADQMKVVKQWGVAVTADTEP